MKILKQVVGRALAAGMRLVGRVTSPAAVARAPAAAMTPELDRTGLCVTRAERLPIAWQDAEVVYPVYETSIAHSFWRAQEFSLLHQHKAELSAPIADFGCGDGSFAAVLFDALDFGIDIDPEALAIAAQFGIYRDPVQADAQCIPLPDESIGSVFSNSALEHVNDLETAVREIPTPPPGGRFLFTVPVKQFERDLTLWFGARESALGEQRLLPSQSARNRRLAIFCCCGMAWSRCWSKSISRPNSPSPTGCIACTGTARSDACCLGYASVYGAAAASISFGAFALRSTEASARAAIACSWPSSARRRSERALGSRVDADRVPVSAAEDEGSA